MKLRFLVLDQKFKFQLVTSYNFHYKVFQIQNIFSKKEKKCIGKFSANVIKCQQKAILFLLQCQTNKNLRHFHSIRHTDSDTHTHTHTHAHTHSQIRTQTHRHRDTHTHTHAHTRTHTQTLAHQ